MAQNSYTKARLQDWLDGDRQPGDRFIYEVNSLGHLHDLPTAAMRLAAELEEQGELLLFQRTRPRIAGKARVLEYEARIPSEAATRIIASLNRPRQTTPATAKSTHLKPVKAPINWVTEVPEKYEIEQPPEPKARRKILGKAQGRALLKAIREDGDARIAHIQSKLGGKANG